VPGVMGGPAARLARQPDAGEGRATTEARHFNRLDLAPHDPHAPHQSDAALWFAADSPL